MTIILTVHNTHMFWPTYGAFLLTMLPFYSDQKSRREDIKARLAEIERGDTIGYPYVMADGHIVLDVNDQSLLLDTGSSRSIGTGELEIDGKTYTLKTRATDVTPEYLSSEIGVKIDALLGMDIIGEYTLIVDPTRQLICFEIMPPESGAAVRIDEYKGIPIIAVTVGGRQIRVFFDTGAPLSYIEPELTENTPVSGTRDHFYAGTGRVTADVYRLDVGIGGETVNLAFGHVPEKLQLILVMAGAQGIIGTELLATHKIALSTSRKKIRLVRL